MGWYVRRNGKLVGPVEESVVVEWVRGGMHDGSVRDEHGGHWKPLVESQFAPVIAPATTHQHFDAALPASKRPGCSPIAIVTIALMSLAGGFAFIISYPVVAIAIVVVGIPFAIFVLRVTGSLLFERR